MFGVDLYGRVRLAVLGQGLSQREAARRFGIDRGTVAKMVSHSVPPGYRRSVEPRRPKLDQHTGFIDQILSDDLSAPKKQRHTIQRIYDRLRAERGFDGGYTTVRDYVHPRRLSLKEAFVPLAHPAGHAQGDFGEAWPRIGGDNRRREPEGAFPRGVAAAQRCDLREGLSGQDRRGFLRGPRGGVCFLRRHTGIGPVR